MTLVTIYMWITSKSITLVHTFFQRFRPDYPTMNITTMWYMYFKFKFFLPSHPSIPILSPAFPETENGIFIPPIAKPNLGLQLLSPLSLYNHAICTCYWSGSPDISWNHPLSPIFKSMCLVSVTILSHFDYYTTLFVFLPPVLLSGPVSGAVDLCISPGPCTQKSPSMLCSVVTTLQSWIFLSLNWYFVSEVQWDNRACVWVEEINAIHMSAISCCYVEEASLRVRERAIRNVEKI